MFKTRTVGTMPVIHAGEAGRVKQMPDIARGNRANIGWCVGHSESGCANFGDLIAKHIGQNGQRIDI